MGSQRRGPVAGSDHDPIEMSPPDERLVRIAADVAEVGITTIPFGRTICGLFYSVVRALPSGRDEDEAAAIAALPFPDDDLGEGGLLKVGVPRSFSRYSYFFRHWSIPLEGNCSFVFDRKVRTEGNTYRPSCSGQRERKHPRDDGQLPMSTCPRILRADAGADS